MIKPLLMAVLPLLAVNALAQAKPKTDLQAQQWAFSCMACHGPDGRAEAPGRALFARPTPELLKLLLAYKTGETPSTIMQQHAKGYSDDELKRIAEVFSALREDSK
jgi:cytochrome c553